jgi:hypothetical protein
MQVPHLLSCPVTSSVDQEDFLAQYFSVYYVQMHALGSEIVTSWLLSIIIEVAVSGHQGWTLTDESP